MAGEEPKTKLFRAEALAEQEDRWLGSVLLVPRIAHSILVGFALLVVLGILALFAFGEYTRKARMGGWLAPEGGLIQVLAPRTGVLTRVNVEEGREVTAGTPLALLSAELRSETLGATRGEVIRQLRARRDSMTAEEARQQVLFEAQADQIAARLVVSQGEAESVNPGDKVGHGSGRMF